MATIDEVQRMEREGRSEQEIIGGLKGRGVPEREIVDAMSQSKIKDAVSANGMPQGALQGAPSEQDMGLPNLSDAGMSAPPPGPGPDIPPMPSTPGQVQEVGASGFEGMPPAPGEQPMGVQDIGGMPPGMEMPPEGGMSEYGGLEPGMDGEYSGMQPSMMGGPGGEMGAQPQSEMYSAGAGGEMVGQPQDGEPGGDLYAPGGGEAYQDYGAYPQYQPYQEAMSSDVITEISEQVVSEKLMHMHDKLEKALDMRTVIDAKVSNLDERLKRMEKVIDRIQLSILQKVGEYLTDVKDVKKELEETQKSFVAIHKKKNTGKRRKK